MNLDYKNFAVVYEPEIDVMAAKLDKSGIFDGQTLRLQADCHVGKGCAVGTSLTYADKIVPSLVGCDIACRVSAFSLGDKAIDLEALDAAIYERVPAGFAIRGTEAEASREFPYENLRCWGAIKEKEERFRKSMGTLGGGNHFISVECGEKSGVYYLVIHTGSRNLGKVVFDYYQNKAIEARDERIANWYKFRDMRTRWLAENGRKEEIQKDREYWQNKIDAEPEDDLAYLEGPVMEDYLHDMDMLRDWSYKSHAVIAAEIRDALGITTTEAITSIHNYVDTAHHIIRKGAIAAYEGERGIIPLNMRDGSLIVIGKGNPDYLWTAPHGAGRIMSRSQAKREIDMAHYQQEMEGIYTTSVASSTLDEAPDAYKKMEDILPAIKDTVDVVERIVPVYNFKAK